MSGKSKIHCTFCGKGFLRKNAEIYRKTKASKTIYCSYECHIEHHSPEFSLTYRIDMNGCWNLTSHARDRKGYGVFNVKGRSKKIHRYMYELMVGKIPAGFSIRHQCDNPGCINPMHLLVGTSQDNTNDMFDRERYRCLHGEEIALSRLKEQDVREMKASLNRLIKYFALKFDVSYRTSKDALIGNSWKHVQIRDTMDPDWDEIAGKL